MPHLSAESPLPNTSRRTRLRLGVGLAAAMICTLPATLPADDCLLTGVPDAQDIAADPALDLNNSGTPDLCENAHYRFPDDGTEALIEVGNTQVYSENLNVGVWGNPGIGAVWLEDSFDLSQGFDTRFVLEVETFWHEPEGFTLTLLANQPGTDTIGTTLGVEGLPGALSLVVGTDAFASEGPMQRGRLSLYSGGTGTLDLEEGTPIETIDTGIDFTESFDGTRFRLLYDTVTLEVFVEDFTTPVMAVEIDIDSLLDLDGGAVWAGFTAQADGLATRREVGPEGHAVTGWLLAPLADCTGTGVPDLLEIRQGWHQDANRNGIPDVCEQDLTGSGFPDHWEIKVGIEQDCNNNGIPDSYEIANGLVSDINGNGIPDECEPDCTRSGVPDSWEIANGIEQDCNGNGIPDRCEWPLPPTLDFTDSTMPGGPTYNFIDISDTDAFPDATVYSFSGDDGTGPVALPFTFDYLGTPASEIWISSNAWVSFRQPASVTARTLPEGLGSYPAVAGGLQMDLRPEQSTPDLVYTAVATGLNGEQLFIVQYENIRLWSFADVRITFQMQFSENGTYEVHIQDIIGRQGVESATYRLAASTAGLDSTYFQSGNINNPDGLVSNIPEYAYTITLPERIMPDCNNTGQWDECDILDGTSFDFNNNGIPDECEEQGCIEIPGEPGKFYPNSYAIASGIATDCNRNGIPDECEIADGAPATDGVLDQCLSCFATDVLGAPITDCNENGIPDACEITQVLYYEDFENFEENGGIERRALDFDALAYTYLSSSLEVTDRCAAMLPGHSPTHAVGLNPFQLEEEGPCTFQSGWFWITAGWDFFGGVSLLPGQTISFNYILDPAEAVFDPLSFHWDEFVVGFVYSTKSGAFGERIIGYWRPASHPYSNMPSDFPDAVEIPVSEQWTSIELPMGPLPDDIEWLEIFINGELTSPQDANGGGQIPFRRDDHEEVRNGFWIDDIMIGRSNWDMLDTGQADICDIDGENETDVNNNGIPDSLEPDCTGSGFPDSWEIEQGFELDLDLDGNPDSCRAIDEIVVHEKATRNRTPTITGEVVGYDESFFLPPIVVVHVNGQILLVDPSDIQFLEVIEDYDGPCPPLPFGGGLPPRRSRTDLRMRWLRRGALSFLGQGSRAAGRRRVRRDRLFSHRGRLLRRIPARRFLSHRHRAVRRLVQFPGYPLGNRQHGGRIDDRHGSADDSGLPGGHGRPPVLRGRARCHRRPA